MPPPPPLPPSSISGFNFQKLFIVQCVRNEDSQESQAGNEIMVSEVAEVGTGAFGDNKSLPFPLAAGSDQLYYTIPSRGGVFLLFFFPFPHVIHALGKRILR
jgi:hypothetical protein